MSTVYACVRVIAETIASLPLHVYQNQGEGSVKALDHPLYPILHDEPNIEMTSFVWRRSCASAALGQRLLSDHPQRPESDSRFVSAAAGSHGSGSRQRGHADLYLLCKQRTDGETHQEDVLHIPGLGFDGIMGYSPIALEKNAIGLGLAAEEYGSKFFSNGARPSGILTHPNTVKDPKKLRDSWNAAYGGSKSPGV